MTQQISC